MKEKRRYDGLLGLRGIGAVSIIAYHMYVLEAYSGCNMILDRTIGIGGVFVQLFFMLSSFSMLCGYADRMNTGELEWESFYIKRFQRLAPTFYFALVCHVVLNVCTGVANSVANILGTASFLYAFMPTNQESVVMAGWALGIEIIFYLLFPIFLVCTKNMRRTLMFLIFSIILHRIYETFYGVGVVNSNINIIYQLLPFVCGAVLYHCITYIEKISVKYRKIIGVVIQVILLLLLICWLRGFNKYLLVYLAFALVIINQIGYKDLLANNVICRCFGKYSYELYLFHMITYRILYYFNINKTIFELSFPKWMNYFILLVIEVTLTLVISSVFVFIKNRIANIRIKNEK